MMNVDRMLENLLHNILYKQLFNKFFQRFDMKKRKTNMHFPAKDQLSSISFK